MNVRVTGTIDGEGRALHLPHPLIHLGLPGELSQLTCRELKHPNITLLRGDGSFDDIDLTLGRNSLRLDLLDELIAELVKRNLG